MSEIPKNLKYSKDHEWVEINDNVATVGITLHAAESLGDIVYVDVNSIDKNLNQFDKFGEIEFLPENTNIINGITNFKVFGQLNSYLKWLYLGFRNRKIIKNNYKN